MNAKKYTLEQTEIQPKRPLPGGKINPSLPKVMPVHVCPRNPPSTTRIGDDHSWKVALYTTLRTITPQGYPERVRKPVGTRPTLIKVVEPPWRHLRWSWANKRIELAFLYICLIPRCWASTSLVVHHAKLWAISSNFQLSGLGETWLVFIVWLDWAAYGVNYCRFRECGTDSI